jgi:glucosamine-6-phosphate deaminase
MECIIRPNAQSAADLVARIIAEELRAKPDMVFGLATGRTMESLYDILAKMHKEEGLDFSLCCSFNLDEYVGLPGTDPQSYRYYMDQHLFSRVNIDRRNTHLPDGAAADPDAESRRYDELIAKKGGVDLQLLGIGRTGHIGFNEPLSALKSRTRVKALAPVTMAQNGPLFKDPSRMPRRAITMGIGTILEARRCILLATGAEKADIIAKAIEGPITAMISATALQLHQRCTVVVDEAAGSKLKESEYYRWIFANEPEWKRFQ